MLLHNGSRGLQRAHVALVIPRHETSAPGPVGRIRRKQGRLRCSILPERRPPVSHSAMVSRETRAPAERVRSLLVRAARSLFRRSSHNSRIPRRSASSLRFQFGQFIARPASRQQHRFTIERRSCTSRSGPSRLDCSRTRACPTPAARCTGAPTRTHRCTHRPVPCRRHTPSILSRATERADVRACDPRD